jgi:hypothetical protein
MVDSSEHRKASQQSSIFGWRTVLSDRVAGKINRRLIDLPESEIDFLGVERPV